MSTHSTASSIAAAKPLLFWALASDNIEKVRELLASGQANANDRAGPEELPALQFVMGNSGLKNQLEFVKILMEYGADPSVLNSQPLSASPEGDGSSSDEEGSPAGGRTDRRDSTATVKGPSRSPKARSSTMTVAKVNGANPAIE
jgi:hypothetical protein